MGNVRLNNFVLEIREFLCAIVFGILKFVVEAVLLIMNLGNVFLGICTRIGMIGWAVNIYFIYTCFREYFTGVKFTETTNFNTALLLFFAPLGIVVLKTLVETIKDALDAWTYRY